jgi:ABC-type transport system involved in multi-copper enzyme maturation permease subunit
VGPLFYYELIRLARRGRSTLVRCVYVFALLVALYLTYHDRFRGHNLLAAPFASPKHVNPAELSRLAFGFVRTILLVQTVAIFVLTPAYLAGSVVEEKQRKTLDLLFTSHLTDREIILGKLAARSVHLGGVLLAGLPLLALIQLWGGVDARLLTAAYLMAGLNLLTIGAVCVLCSVQARTVTGAVFASYIATAILSSLCACCSSTGIGVFDTLTDEPFVSLQYRAGAIRTRSRWGLSSFPWCGAPPSTASFCCSALASPQ